MIYLAGFLIYLFGVYIGIKSTEREEVSDTNLNTFARDITIKEGLKKQVSIAQVKEIIKLVLVELSRMDEATVIKLLKKYQPKRKKK